LVAAALTRSRKENPMDEKEDPFEELWHYAQKKLSPEQRTRLRKHFAEPLSALYCRNLRRLARIYGSDKWGGHWYCQHYERHLAHLRTKRITLLEIGIGGYADAKLGGGSLRMWRRYFPRGQIYGIDIEDKRSHDERRIHTFRGDQNDERFLVGVIAKIGKPDIIIDDGSHLNSHVVNSFRILFPHLADNGIYVVEDTQTSYWPDYGGNSDDLQTAPTSMSLLKNLVDGLNYREFVRPNYVPSYFDKHIISISFYHNIVFIAKGLNNEESNRW
jgi:hypothetical protein